MGTSENSNVISDTAKVLKSQQNTVAALGAAGIKTGDLIARLDKAVEACAAVTPTTAKDTSPAWRKESSVKGASSPTISHR